MDAVPDGNDNKAISCLYPFKDKNAVLRVETKLLNRVDTFGYK